MKSGTSEGIIIISRNKQEDEYQLKHQQKKQVVEINYGYQL